MGVLFFGDLLRQVSNGLGNKPLSETVFIETNDTFLHNFKYD